jgi:hypothetical protein
MVRNWEITGPQQLQQQDLLVDLLEDGWGLNPPADKPVRAGRTEKAIGTS